MRIRLVSIEEIATFADSRSTRARRAGMRSELGTVIFSWRGFTIGIVGIQLH
jgi:hypothetical protein